MPPFGTSGCARQARHRVMHGVSAGTPEVARSEESPDMELSEGYPIKKEPGMVGSPLHFDLAHGLRVGASTSAMLLRIPFMARLIAYFFVGIIHAIGPLVLIVAFASSIPTFEFVHQSIPADATIVDLKRVYLPRRSKEVYFPVFRFSGSDGQAYMVRANSNASLVPLKIGDRVRVLYLKDHPETARIDSIPQLWMVQLILGFGGALFCVFSARIILRRRAPRNATPLSV